MIFSRDTNLEADRIMVELLRQATIGRKWIMLNEQCDLVRSLARSGLRVARDSALGRYLAATPTEVLRRVVNVLDELGVPCVR